MPKKKIFISSVQKEFANERKLLFTYLMDDPLLSKFFTPFIFEDYPAAGRKTSSVYLKEVESSDIYMGIYGDEYGYQNKDGVSPTEQEYDLAQKLNKECLIFIKRDNTNRQTKEKEFIQKVEQDVIRKTFNDYEELKAAIYKSLILYLDENEFLRTVPFDKAKDNEATIKDIDEDKVKKFIEMSKQNRNFKTGRATATKDFLKHLDLMDDKGKITNAAILLFGKKPQKFFISSEVKCCQFYGNVVEKPIPSQSIYKGDVFELIDQATSFVMSRVDNWVGTRNSGPTAAVPTRTELPIDAVREAIVNAVCHRDYTSNASVQVMLFKNRLEIWNPGQLPQGLTTQKLYKPHKSKPRNLLIAEPMQRCGYIEKAGTGTGDIVKQCLDFGLKKPVFEQDGDFKVIIWRPVFDQAGLTQGPTSGLTQGPTSGLTLNDCQKQILEFLNQGPQTTATLQKLSGRSNRTKFKDAIIRPLLEAELIEPTHPQNMHHPQSGYKLKKR